MEITKVFETPEGNVKFSGTLKGQELHAVIEVGLNTLFRAGAIPFQLAEEDTAHVVHPYPKSPQ